MIFERADFSDPIQRNCFHCWKRPFSTLCTFLPTYIVLLYSSLWLKAVVFTVFLAFRPTAMRRLIWKSFFFKFNASLVVRSLFYFVGVSNHRLLEWFSSYLPTSLSAFRSGMGNLFTIAGHVNCGISLAGRKIN